ncbi:MAG: autotransporter-associated beta strand repeat-containing protein, partial [Deltaproteobacteria bacterium]|nr:autotransporter-associated beta strand repeat-containing protein [Deltaproteobacteria bacterium]
MTLHALRALASCLVLSLVLPSVAAAGDPIVTIESDTTWYYDFAEKTVPDIPGIPDLKFDGAFRQGSEDDSPIVEPGTAYVIAEGATLTLSVERELIAQAYLPNDLSGEGAVVLENGGGLSLLGANSYEGGTTVKDGSLAGSIDSLGGSIEVKSGATAITSLIMGDKDDSSTFAGKVDGAGYYVKSGDPTLLLDEANAELTQAGGTYVTGGALQTRASMIPGRVILDVPPSLPPRNAADAVLTLFYGTDPILALVQPEDETLADSISGIGALIKYGEGTLILDGTNSYSGGTTVIGGALQGDADSLVGDIALDPAATLPVSSALPAGDSPVLEFVQDSAGTHSGNITGDTGSLVKAGAGTLSLRGVNSYGGGTKILGGGLNVKASNFTGDVKLGSIDSEDHLSTEDSQGDDYGGTAVLIFDESSDASYSGTITGSGNLEKLGAGILTLASNQSFDGRTIVTAGILDLAATLMSPIDVGAAGTLAGTGTSQGELTAAGTISPRTMGTGESLTVTGATFADGSILSVRVVAADDLIGDADHLQINGQATFDADGTTLLDVDRLPSDYGEDPWNYLVATATGTFDNTDSLVAVDISYLG